MLGIIKSIFGTKHDKDVKAIRPLVDEINTAYDTLHDLSDEELKAKTSEFRQRVTDSVVELNAERDELNAKLQTGEVDYHEREAVYQRLTEIGKEEFATIQNTLNEILPEAFAVVKEACKRLTERKHSYIVSGHEVVWEMIPYDVQMIGGVVLHQGKISEMATGEGKTLVAVAPLYLNGLSGKGVHLVTVNDYLAKRDSDWMKPVFDFLEVKLGCIQGNMSPHQRHHEYGCDVTYGTNNEFGFDYLRDNMVNDKQDMVQREHWFAVVDEVDSVLVDEARTPLIISGPVPNATDQQFEQLVPRVRRMVDEQTKLVAGFVAKIDALMQSGKKEDKYSAGEELLKSHRGMPKHPRLLKTLHNPDAGKLLKEAELEFLKEQGLKMMEIDDQLFFSVDERNHGIDIGEKGRTLLASGHEDPDLFLIPDIAWEFSQIEGNEDLPQEEKQILKDEKMRIFADRSDRIHTVQQLLRAYTLYQKDDEYVVQDGKIKIVDEFTGRILEGRRYSDGLHQAIEAKEGVRVEEDTQTFATITLQNYFRLYRKLSGMTGTAETEAGEFLKIYNLDVVVIPTNRPVTRKDENDYIFRTKREKYNAVVEEIQRQLSIGRPILVGTTSVEVSEILDKMLQRAKITHNVLNAKQHAREAEIVAEAGRTGAVTIATNMAGRGTDIKLTPETKAAGGLAIIGTERHEARRIDRQLRGRAGRQGDPGSSTFFISLEDDLMRLFGGERVAGVMQRLKVPDGEPIQAGMITKSVENAQKKVEANNFSIRKRLIDYDDVMNQQREVIYDRRRHALNGERMKGEIFNYIEEIAGYWYEEFHASNDWNGMLNSCRTSLLCEPEISEKDFRDMDEQAFVEKIMNAATAYYDRKEQHLGVDFMARLETYAILNTIDDKWREHLRTMDDLKEGIYLRSYGQKDPLLEYKGEAYKLFIELIKDINVEASNFAFKFFPAESQRAEPVSAVPKIRSNVTTSKQLQFTHASASNVSYSGGEATDQPRKGTTIVRSEERIGRNDPCHCGSGKKYKQCHGKGI